MICMKEQQLFSLGSNVTNVSIPDGAYVCAAVLKNGMVYISYLCDDTKPYSFRKFICTGSFTDVGYMANGKRCWYIDKIVMPDPYPNSAPFYYYVLGVDQ